jgi:hypothetical protein
VIADESFCFTLGSTDAALLAGRPSYPFTFSFYG